MAKSLAKRSPARSSFHHIATMKKNQPAGYSGNKLVYTFQSFPGYINRDKRHRIICIFKRHAVCRRSRYWPRANDVRTTMRTSPSLITIITIASNILDLIYKSRWRLYIKALGFPFFLCLNFV